MKKLNKYIESKLDVNRKKRIKLMQKVDKRQAESKLKFPNTNVLEMETIEDWISLADLESEARTLTKLKKNFKNG